MPTKVSVCSSSCLLSCQALLAPESTTGALTSHDELQPSKTSDVCLLGFEHILGLLVTSEPLSVPRLRQGLGKLTSSIFGLFSGRMILLASASASQASLLDKAVQALSLCIKMDENETAQLGLESIVAFCKVVSVHFSQQLSPQLVAALHGCLSSVMRLLLAEPLDSTLFWTSLFALSSLIKVSRSTDLGQAMNKAVEGVESKETFQHAAQELVESALGPLVKMMRIGSTNPSKSCLVGAVRSAFASTHHYCSTFCLSHLCNAFANLIDHHITHLLSCALQSDCKMRIFDFRMRETQRTILSVT